MCGHCGLTWIAEKEKFIRSNSTPGWPLELIIKQQFCPHLSLSRPGAVFTSTGS